MVLWRVRAEVDEKPGRLAALATGLAAHDGNILGLSVQPGQSGTIDEFFIDMPSGVSGSLLTQALTAAGGRDAVALRATMHDLVDRSTRALLLAVRVRESVEELPAVLAELLRADECHWVADDDRETGVEDGRLEHGGLVLTLLGPEGCPIRLRRYDMAFTVTEVARAMAMIRLADRSPTGWDTSFDPGARFRAENAGPGSSFCPRKVAQRLLAWLWRSHLRMGARQDALRPVAPGRARDDRVPDPEAGRP